MARRVPKPSLDLKGEVPAVEIALQPEKTLGPLERTREQRSAEPPYLDREREIKGWQAWVTTSHTISSQKRIILFCMALLSVLFLAWLAATFLWALGLLPRMDASFLKFWLVTITGGVIGTAFSTVVRAMFPKARSRR